MLRYDYLSVIIVTTCVQMQSHHMPSTEMPSPEIERIGDQLAVDPPSLLTRDSEWKKMGRIG